MPFVNVEDRREYRRKCFQINKVRFNEDSVRWKKANRDRYLSTQVRYKESSFKVFLRQSLYRVNKQKHECSIDLNYLLNILEQQKEYCAITGLPLLHEQNSLYSVSIDRIDSSKGYVPGNVQLVCKFVNLGKSVHSNDEVRAFISAVRAIKA